jgi:hypothetical protein
MGKGNIQGLKRIDKWKNTVLGNCGNCGYNRYVSCKIGWKVKSIQEYRVEGIICMIGKQIRSNWKKVY